MKRPLRLTAPWYRWERQGVHPRHSRPVIQKYDGPDMVETFQRDPQRSLVFTADDVRYTTVAVEDTAPPLERLAGYILESTNTRKLFLAAHKRFYLVVCELHCDGPGLPDLPAGRAAEYGFVVRRLRGGVEGDDVVDAPRLAPLLELSEKVTQLRAVSSSTPPAVGFFRARKRGTPESQVHEAFARTRDDTVAALAADILRLRGEVADVVGSEDAALRRLEGWIPSEHDGVGSWAPVAAEPDELRERVHPLYPLYPDPGAEEHSSGGATLFYGVIPTSSLDTDPWGAPHLGPDHNYRIRCFVREPAEGGCPGPLRWSRPTEEFRLAAHMDPVGTGNRAVTIQMPDLKELAAQAVSGGRPPGGVHMVTPEASEPTATVDDDGNPVPGGFGGGQICSFSIPLITIVARFLLSIFLPIVVIIFKLWWMLLLKLCIPPSVGFDAKLEAAADLEGSFSAGADLSVEVKAELEVALEGAPVPQTHGELREDVLREMTGADGATVLGEPFDDIDGDEFAAMAGVRLAHQRAAVDGAAAAADGVPAEAAGVPSLLDGLEWEPRVWERPTVSAVVARLGAA